MYYYLFYTLYKFWENISYPRFWSDIKASVSILALQIWLLISLFVYYNIFIDRFFNLNDYLSLFFILVLILLIIDYYTFNNKNKWMIILDEFDKLPKKKNIIGSVVVGVFILLIILNLIYSFYLMSQIDWSQYK